MVQPRMAASLMGEKAHIDTREVGQPRPRRSRCQSRAAGPGEGPCDKGAGHGAGRRAWRAEEQNC